MERDAGAEGRAGVGDLPFPPLRSPSLQREMANGWYAAPASPSYQPFPISRGLDRRHARTPGACDSRAGRRDGGIPGRRTQPADGGGGGGGGAGGAPAGGGGGAAGAPAGGGGGAAGAPPGGGGGGAKPPPGGGGGAAPGGGGGAPAPGGGGGGALGAPAPPGAAAPPTDPDHPPAAAAPGGGGGAVCKVRLGRPPAASIARRAVRTRSRSSAAKGRPVASAYASTPRSRK
jgi:hypothetical protein